MVLTCTSHSANVVGKIMIRAEECPLPLARQFEQWWSNLISTCPRARSLFHTLCKKSVVRSSEIRWFCWFEVIDQLYVQAVAVEGVIKSEEDFGSELRMKLKALLEEETVEGQKLS